MEARSRSPGPRLAGAAGAAGESALSPVLLEDRAWLPPPCDTAKLSGPVPESSQGGSQTHCHAPFLGRDEEGHVTQHAEHGWLEGAREPGEGTPGSGGTGLQRLGEDLYKELALVRAGIGMDPHT